MFINYFLVFPQHHLNFVMFRIQLLVCRNPNLGLVTKARAYKGACQEVSPGVTSHDPRSAKECEGMNPHTTKELPFWELKSQWILKFS
jgi:hypothetical protein